MNVFCFYCNLNAFVQHLSFWAFCNFWGATRSLPPKSQGACMPMLVIWDNQRLSLCQVLKSSTAIIKVVAYLVIETWFYKAVKLQSAPMIKFSMYIFLHFCTQQVFPGHLAKFQSITKYRTQVFWTISVENCTNAGAKVFVLCVNCCTNCYYIISICAVFLKVWPHLLQFQEPRTGTRKTNLILRNEGPKIRRCNVSNRLKFGKITRKDVLVWKCKKMDIKNLIIVAL